MTLIPNLLVTGVLAIMLSALFLVWVTLYIDRPHGGFVLILISLAMLLTGAGFGPPLLGFILGVTATRINGQLTWWRSHLPEKLGAWSSFLWPWFLAAGVVVWLMIFPGAVLYVYFSGVDPESASVAAAVTLVIASAFGLLLLSLFSGLLRDAYGYTRANSIRERV
jgi:hypothetical protein